MAHCVDLVLCIFPFEADLYKKSGIRAVFVGHPMMERLQAQKIDVERDPNLIGLFPGSRLREVRKILPIMMETARQLLRRKPTLHFQIAAASEELAREMERLWHRHPADELHGLEAGAKIAIKVGETAEIMQRAWAGIVASGSATLEAAYFRMPFVLVYEVAWPTYLAARAVVNVNYLGMPNLLADKQVVPEFIQQQAKPGAIAKAIEPLVEDVRAREQMISAFDAIISKLGGGGASEHAAQAILEELKEGRSPSPPGGLPPSKDYGATGKTAAP
jgi:lipid-A-disaccharide synthase